MDNRNQIDEIKEALDIVAIVNGYVPTLKKSGRNYFGLCPFHKEKTPSFSVNPELKLFKCFGCGEGGDVIKFLEKIEGLDFPKALELAASKAGIKLNKQVGINNDKLTKEKQKILEANLLTAKYYNYLLLTHDLGKLGRVYARARKLRKEELEKFLIGYAPSGYNNLKNFLLGKGFTTEELINWGLLVSKNGRVYDKFRNRLMFSIFDHQGDVVGFSGRLIDSNALGPKYLNSPETLVYKKSKILYGLYQAKDSIRKENFTVLVEGNVDILSSHRIGIENIVAPLGTALTIDQVKLLKRYCDSIYFALDTDAAGQKALERDLPILEEVNVKAYILDLGKYKDVDDLIVNNEDFSKVVEKPLEVVPYFINSLKNNYDLSKAFSKTEYIRKILSFISKTKDNLLQIDYLKRLEDIVNVDIKILKNELINIKSNVSKQNNDDEFLSIKKVKEKDLLLKYILALSSEHRDHKEIIEEIVLSAHILSLEYLNVFKAIWDPNLNKKFALKEQELYEEISLQNVPVFSDNEKFEKELRQIVKRVKKEIIKEKLDKLKLLVKEEKSEELLNKLQTLTKQLSQLDVVQ